MLTKVKKQHIDRLVQLKKFDAARQYIMRLDHPNHTQLLRSIDIAEANYNRKLKQTLARMIDGLSTESQFAQTQ